MNAVQDKMEEESLNRRTRLKNFYFDDPSRETSTIIEERMYDDENDKGYNELRLIANETLVKVLNCARYFTSKGRQNYW